MGRSTKFLHSLLAQVRAYYGLRQQELAALLGVGESLVGHLEAGRRALTLAVLDRLAPFTRQMVEETGPLPTAPPLGVFDHGPLEARRVACLHEAANLRWAVRGLPAQAAVAARWVQALPGLLAALPPPPPADEAPATAEAVRLRYAHAWLALRPQALPPEELARWYLAGARATALEAEAAALAVRLSE
ncbi:helix-turn-helix domain-containing protein [Hymenobacter negativus]|uniref:Helix-turn-helix transcriptional regulator n=1 Tax=Hymenobacter negativus TaxID=2795026 RepID=A0ABS3QI85_9BACT|nr:helix-turn-helix transcriptional regulator [Hymenobacter negativus]MBO2010939.1 helix-turn-helix transcriptional regulator [Hymenobacter negativus]